MSKAPAPLLQVTGLHAEINTYSGQAIALSGVSLSLQPGEILGLSGWTGEGRGLIVKALSGTLPGNVRLTRGEVRLSGRDISAMKKKEAASVRATGMVPAPSALGGRLPGKIAKEITRPMRRVLGYDRASARKRAAELLGLVGITEPDKALDRKPGQLNAAEQARLRLAIALACDPKIILLDDPCDGLGPEEAAEFAALLGRLREDLSVSFIWTSGDLAQLAGVCDRVMVLYAGQVVEHARGEHLLASPRHPYTRALLAGDAPAAPQEWLAEPADRCAYGPHCPELFPRCCVENPTRRIVGDGRDVACWWEAETGEPYQGD